MAEDHDPDAEFRELIGKTFEFDEHDPVYESALRYNLNAIDRAEQVVEALAPYVTIAGARALDIGAGSAGLAIALANRGASVEGLEPDAVRLEWARARVRGHGSDVSLQAAPAEAVPFPDASFDIVTLYAVLEHVENTRATIAEIARVLRPGGVAYVVWPNKLSLLTILHDPHYGKLGVVLMPRRLGRWYIEDVRRHPRGYWVNHIPTPRWVRRRFADGGVSVHRLPPESFSKLRHPEQITRHAMVRRLAQVANAVRLVSLLEFVAVRQDAVHTVIGVKTR